MRFAGALYGKPMISSLVERANLWATNGGFKLAKVERLTRFRARSLFLSGRQTNKLVGSGNLEQILSLHLENDRIIIHKARQIVEQVSGQPMASFTGSAGRLAARLD